MSKKTMTVSKSRENQNKRFAEAQKSFQEMQKKIAPFVKPRVSKVHSTAGRWCNTSDSR